MQQLRCANDNHGRAIVTVRFCSHCGGVVNDRIRSTPCEPASHARMRRTQSAFCVDCGEPLLQARAAR